jgi:hypothetical protein
MLALTITVGGCNQAPGCAAACTGVQLALGGVLRDSPLVCMPPAARYSQVALLCCCLQEAHETGVAMVVACAQEQAETYVETLRLNGLISTMEPGR